MKLITLLIALSCSLLAQTSAYIATGNPAPYTDSTGQVWAADLGQCSGGTVFAVTNVITGTPDQTLYKFGRQGNSSCSATLLPGLYQITLKFADVLGFSIPGQQVFNIYVNNTLQFASFDIFNTVRGQNVAYDVVLPIYANLVGPIAISVSQISGSAQLQAVSMQLRTFGSVVPTFVSSVFTRVGNVVAGTGDYTSAQVTESGNLYFTPARAQAAMAGLYQTPISGAPGTWPTLGTASAHAATDFEPALGNPSVNGYVLSSTTAGVRSWVAQSGGGGGAGLGANTFTRGQQINGTVDEVQWGVKCATGQSTYPAALVQDPSGNALMAVWCDGHVDIGNGSGPWTLTNTIDPGTTPSSGQSYARVDPTSKVMIIKNDAAVNSNTVIPASAGTGQAVTGISAGGVISFGQMSGGLTAASGSMPGKIIENDHFVCLIDGSYTHALCETPWNLAPVGDGGNCNVIANAWGGFSATRPGVMLVGANATSDGCEMYKSANLPAPSAISTYSTQTFVFAFNSPPATQGSMRVGLTDTTGTITPTNFIGFRAISGTDTYIKADSCAATCTPGGGTDTASAGTANVAYASNHDYLMQIVITSGSPVSVAFTLKDLTAATSSTATITTNIPASVFLTPWMFWKNGATVQYVRPVVTYFGMDLEGLS